MSTVTDPNWGAQPQPGYPAQPVVVPPAPVEPLIEPRSRFTAIAWAQALYFLATGLWPIVDINSFMAVTGPKSDVWLVRTVGLLIMAIGASLLAGAYRGRVTPQTVVLGVGSALALLAVDVIYVTAGRISSIYLVDAFIEGMIVLGWVWVGVGHKVASPRPFSPSPDTRVFGRPV